MKHPRLFNRLLRETTGRCLMLLLMALLCTPSALAYDFSAPNEQGQILYYKFLGNHKVAVTYRYETTYGDSFDHYGDVVIPSTVDYNGETYNVTAIGDYTFRHADITSITLPNSIERIGSYAFNNCHNITTLTIPENVTFIGLSAIFNNTNLKTLYYNARNAECDHESNINNVGEEFFYGAIEVKSDCEVIINDNIEHIPDYFLCWSSITSINIPSSVTSIGDGAFYRTKLNSVILPSGVTSIGANAFKDCSSLRNVVCLMTTPAAIQSSTFPNRTNQTLYIPEGCAPNYVVANYWKEFKYILEASRIYFVDSRVEAICVANWDTDHNGYLDQIEAMQVTDLGTIFQGNNQISSFNELQYFKGLSKIPDNAFSGCSNLTSVTLPDRLSRIGNSAFKNCIRLSAIVFPSTMRTIDDEAFRGCTNLSSISGYKDVTTIGTRAFANCSSLQSVGISRTTNVNSAAFEGCTGLTRVIFRPSLLASYTFQGCTSLTDVTLENTVTDLQEGAFKDCTALTTITLPSSINSINGSFEGCISLSSVTLQKGLKYIYDKSFKGCSSLTAISLPTGLLTIGESAFDGTGLTEINIPSTVTSILSRAFADCSDMTKVIVRMTNPIGIPAEAFPNRANQYLIVPDGTVAAYQAASVWKDFKGIFQGGIEYGIKIGGIAVNEFNAADITGDCITRGTVSFDPETHVLTLTDATIESGTESGIWVKTDYAFEDLTIKLVGYNILNNIENYKDVSLACNTTITGPGKLVMNNWGEIRMYQSKDLTIEGGCTIRGRHIGGYNGNGILTVKGDYTQVELTFGIVSFANVILQDGLYYEKPKGGHYDTDNFYVVDSLGNKCTDGVIIRRENLIPYVIYHGDLETLTFYNDGQMPGHLSGVTVAYFLNEGDDLPEWYNDGRHQYITKVIFDESFAHAAPTSTYNWFNEMYNLTSIEGIENLNTSEVTNMCAMFGDCSRLTSLDVSHFDTRNVTTMAYMFYTCEALTSLDLSAFDTHNVTNMSGMFESCTGLTSLDLSGFDTRNVTDMYGMFEACDGLTSLDLSGFDTHNVTDMGYMFSYCDNLKTIYVGDGWNTAAVTNSDAMFYELPSLVGGMGTTYDANHTDMAYAHIDGGPSNPGYFSGLLSDYAVLSSDGKTLTFYCDGLKNTRPGTKYDLNEGANNPGWYSDNSYGNVTTVVFDPSFADARPTSTYWWFSNMGNLSSIEGIEYLNTSKVINMSRMFSLCWSMESLDLSHFDTGNVTDMSYMFNYCEALTSLDLRSFDTHNVFDMEDMFYECSSLTSLDLSSFNTENVNNFKEMFYDCASLNSMDLQNFDTRNADTMNGMFWDCSGLTSLDLSSFNTANVTDMGYMFDGCHNLETVYVGDEWSTAGVTNSSSMFGGCTSIVGGMGTTYDANHTDMAYAHIDGGPSDPGYFSEKVDFLRGDVNNDGVVSVSDVTALIDYLLSGDASAINIDAADCNLDSGVTIPDVTSLIDYLLSGAWAN